MSKVSNSLQQRHGAAGRLVRSDVVDAFNVRNAVTAPSSASPSSTSLRHHDSPALPLLKTRARTYFRDLNNHERSIMAPDTTKNTKLDTLPSVNPYLPRVCRSLHSSLSNEHIKNVFCRKLTEKLLRELLVPYPNHVRSCKHIENTTATQMSMLLERSGITTAELWVLAADVPRVRVEYGTRTFNHKSMMLRLPRGTRIPPGLQKNGEIEIKIVMVPVVGEIPPGEGRASGWPGWHDRN